MLAILVENAHTVVARIAGRDIAAQVTVRTQDRTADEWGWVVSRVATGDTDAVVSCVVPGVMTSLSTALQHRGCAVRVVGEGLKTGLKLRTANPREVGSDRIVNAVAAVDTYGAPVVVVNAGAALTIDCVNPAGEYVGGVIAPGLSAMGAALSDATAKLPKIAVHRTDTAIGTSTEVAMQSGLYWGYTGLVDRLVMRCVDALGVPATVVGTGLGLAVLHADCETLGPYDADLSLRGLALIAERNPLRGRS